jgi:transcriptional regulator of heat shock response
LSSDPDLAPANISPSVHPLLVITNKQTIVELPKTADAIKKMKVIIREVSDMNTHVTTEVTASLSEATDATEVVTTTMIEEEAIGDATIIEGMTVTVGMVDPVTAMRVEEETISLKVVVEESTVDSMRNHLHQKIITRRSQEIWGE